jgi:hypothetical protein
LEVPVPYLWCGQQDTKGRKMMKPRHHLFHFIDSMPKDVLKKTIKNGDKTVLKVYLKSIMHFYVAQNKLQSEMKGDESDFCNMLAEEYSE